MKPKAILFLLGAAGAVVCLALNAYTLYRVGWGWGNDAKTMNEAGDFLGGITAPLLNFLTFIAVLYTTAMQAEELRISNETLSATQSELAQSRETAQRPFEKCWR
nr:hypothetical protein [uncultured Azospirillum sp.]